MHTGIERLAPTVTQRELAAAEHTLGCELREPRGSSRSGSGGVFCATHHEGQYVADGKRACRRAWFTALGICGHALCAERDSCALDD